MTAIFDLSLPWYKVTGPWPRVFRVPLDQFSETTILVPEKHGFHRRAGEVVLTHVCAGGTVLVSSTEADAPPKIGKASTGHREMASRSAYFSQRAAYRTAGATVVARLVDFMRYELRQTARGQGVLAANPSWFDGRGVEFETGVIELTGSVEDVGRYSERVLEPAAESALSAALYSDRATTLAEFFLSEAQSAAMAGRIERAVLELAISCEVLIKSAAFGQSGRASRVFEVLEDERPGQTKVLSLLDALGHSHPGHMFKAASPTSYRDIECIFRARNKVAHRGKAEFSDHKGDQQAVDKKILERWWRSVDTLTKWIQALPN